MNLVSKSLTRVFGAFAIAFLLALAAPCFAHAATVSAKGVSYSDGIYVAHAKQAAIDSREVDVKVYNVKSLKRSGVYKVRAIAEMLSGKTVTASRYKTQTIASVSKKAVSFTMEVPQYGRYRLTVKYLKSNGSLVRKETVNNLGVAAKEYNIAAFNGTFAPLFFSLSMWDDSVMKTSAGKSIPTYIALSRSDAYNWKQLPSGVYSNPLATSPTKGSFASKVKKLATYVSDLKKMNKNSKFHFYFADNYVNGIFDLALSNRLADNRYDVTLITDGSGSYSYFNDVYNNESAQSAYDSMAKQYAKYKTKWQNGKTPSLKGLKYSINSNSLSLSKYAYVAVSKYDNVKWWVSRKSGTFACPDADFLTAALGCMEEKSMNTMLTALKTAGESEAFKNLYHFSNTMFSAAEKSGKQVMILMGTRVPNEKNFEQFASFVKKYYGSAYEYYYKGHPATPTKLYPSKQEELDKLGITDVESSIPAELILFFYSDVYVSGLSNSTLNQSYKAGNTKAYLGARKASALKPVSEGGVYASELFELFFTQITDSYESAVTSLCPNTTHSYYLVEYVDTSKADIAIYDYTANTITNYKLQSDGSYAQV